MRIVIAAVFAALLAAPAACSDFGFARIRSARGDALGAVTFRPFAASRTAVVPLFVLVEPGGEKGPWLRAKQVAHLLPKAVERMVAGDVIKLGTDADGNPALIVGAPGPVAKGDLSVIAVLPADAQRFARERGEQRALAAADVAKYWKLLFEDVVTVFVRFPVRRDPTLADKLNLGATRSGVLLKRLVVEVGVLLRYEDLALDRASATQVKAKTLEVLDAMTQEQWGQLSELAFRVPADLDLAAFGDEAQPPSRVMMAPEDGEPRPTPSPVQIYDEPDRSVWPGIGAGPPGSETLKSTGETATRIGGAPVDEAEQEAADRAARLKNAR